MYNLGAGAKPALPKKATMDNTVGFLSGVLLCLLGMTVAIIVLIHSIRDELKQRQQSERERRVPATERFNKNC